MENPIKMDDLGPTIIFGNTHILPTLKRWLPTLVVWLWQQTLDWDVVATPWRGNIQKIRLTTVTSAPNHVFNNKKDGVLSWHNLSGGNNRRSFCQPGMQNMKTRSLNLSYKPWEHKTGDLSTSFWIFNIVSSVYIWSVRYCASTRAFLTNGVLLLHLFAFELLELLAQALNVDVKSCFSRCAVMTVISCCS